MELYLLRCGPVDRHTRDKGYTIPNISRVVHTSVLHSTLKTIPQHLLALSALQSPTIHYQFQTCSPCYYTFNALTDFPHVIAIHSPLDV